MGWDGMGWDGSVRVLGMLIFPRVRPSLPIIASQVTSPFRLLLVIVSPGKGGQARSRRAKP